MSSLLCARNLRTLLNFQQLSCSFSVVIYLKARGRLAEGRAAWVVGALEQGGRDRTQKARFCSGPQDRGLHADRRASGGPPA